MSTNQNGLSLEELSQRLNELESRISQLESGTVLQQTGTDETAEELSLKPLKNFSDNLFSESRIGESGLAWLGNIVLFLGITFFEQFLDNAGRPVASTLFGFLAVAGIFTMSHFLKRSNPRMSFIFNLNAYILLFYVTLRMHFFTEVPLVENKFLGLFLMALVAAVQLFIALKKRSVVLTGMNLVFLAVIATLSGNTHFMFPVMVVAASLATWYLFRYGWVGLFRLSIVLTYIVCLIWFLNNPVTGNPLQAIQEHQFGYLYIFLFAAIYSLAALKGKPEVFSNTSLTMTLLLNGLGFTILLLLIITTFFSEDYIVMLSLVSTACLLYAVLLQIRTDRKIPPALYALYGFVTLSVAMYGAFGLPEAYFTLAIQSLLVVSIAIWFRSKFIVVMNALLFIILLIIYVGSGPLINEVNVSFSLAALITARILNWKKERLTIRTEMLRNFYLLLGFVMVLITFYHMIPDKYVTLSWAAVALVYFGLSLLLKNVKYRWMALSTLIAAAFYLFIVDLSRIELVYRVLALLFLAAISIGLSIYYTRGSRAKNPEVE